MNYHRSAKIRGVAVAITTALAVVLATLPPEPVAVAAGTAESLPAGAQTEPPPQRTGSADQPPSVTSGETTSVSPPRAKVRPPGAVAEVKPAPSVVLPQPAPRQHLTGVKLRQVARSGDGFDERSRRELRSEWTEETRVYRDADGTTERRLYSGPVNAPLPGGGWAPVDLRLVQAANGRIAPVLSRYGIGFGRTAADPELGVLRLDDDQVMSIALRDTRDVPGQTGRDGVRYPAVRSGVDLALSATETGLGHRLVLGSARAPVEYDFELRLRGLTPHLTSAGEIRLTDRDGDSVAVLPPVEVVDAKGMVSPASRAALRRDGDAWLIKVLVDRKWMTEPARAFPVMVQQAAIHLNADSDDTYVTTGTTANRSADERLRIGNRPGVGLSAGFLHFSGMSSATMRNQYVTGIALNLHTIEVPNCTPKPVDVFAVARPWSGADTRTWPGPGLGRHLGQAAFAYGIPGSCPTNRGTIDLNPDEATDWTHGAPFHGVAVRAANEGDTGAWKSFASANTPAADGKPFLDVTYSPQGAAYRVDEVTLPTNTLPGQLKATVTNRGSATWTPAGPHKFGVYVRGTSHVGKHAVPANVAPGASVQLVVPLPALPPEVTYDVDLTMFEGNADYQPTYGVPYGRFPLRVENVAPSMIDQQPPGGAQVDSIRPTLYGEAKDTDGWPGKGLKYSFKICSGTPEAPVDCQQSGWTEATWTPPKPLKWSQTYNWWVSAYDTAKAGPVVGPLQLTTQVPQPQITAHLGGTPVGAPAAGLDPQVGNFGLTTTDAAVTTVGPDLTVARTYNSLDPRTDTAFGQGWASRLDTQLVGDADGSGNVVVTLPTGRQVRFGKNPDGTYAPPQGQNLTLVHQTSTGYYSLRDATGTRWDFNPYGKLRTITDSVGLVAELEYDDAGPNGRAKAVHNLTSKRRIHLTWTGGHITSVRTDPPASGQQGLLWTYTYDGHKLTAACAPGSAPNCTEYDYQKGSHYRSVVLDDNPRTYWRFGESAAADGAKSAAARKPEADKGTYTGVALGAQGALTGTSDTAAAFGGPGSTSRVVMPTKLTSQSMSLAVELWFKTTSGGVLMSYADQPFGTPASSYAPILYVGQDGLLRGGFWVSKTSGERQIESAQAVNDGAWHHVVLSGSIDKQDLFLDGERLPGTITGAIDHDGLENLVVGAGNTKHWPGGNNGDFHFTGSIDEVATYLHPLGATAAAQHFAARQEVVQLTKVRLPQDGRVAAEIGYDDLNDRVSTLTDRDGRTWRPGLAVRDEGVRRVTLQGPYPDWKYEYDADHGGRLMSTVHDGKKREYKYNTAGFRSQEINELGHKVSFTTDARGNVLSTSTCRTAGSCQTSYSTYHLDPADPLDPVNDRKASDSDARSANATDTTYRTTYEYDPVGRLARTTSPRTNGLTPVEIWKYSTGTEPAVGGGTTPAGLLLEQTGKRPGQVTRHLYRSTGDLAETVDPAGLRTQYDNDSLGRKVVEKTLSAAGAEIRRSTITYTARSEVDTVTGSPVPNALIQTTSTPVTDYDYDANGNTIRMTASDAGGHTPARVTSYEYDARDHLVLTRYPGGGEERKEYLDAGRQVRTTDPAGTTWIDYLDSQSRLVRKVASGQGVDPDDAGSTLLTLEVNTYDPAGRLISRRDAIGRETTWTYYQDDLPDTVTAAGIRQSKAEYDPAGNLVKETGPDGTVTTTAYDPAGHVASVVLDPTGLNRKTTYVRDAGGLPTSETRTGAAQPDRADTIGYRYDAAGRLIREEVTVSPGTVVSVDHELDERGLVRSTTDRNRNTTDYQYDSYDRLVAETLPEVITWTGATQQTVRPRTTYAHNVFGDVTHHRDANGALTVVEHDGRGLATAVRRPSYTPPGGSVINAVDRTEYDAVGNPRFSIDPLGRKTERRYDPYGRLLQETLPQVGDTPSTTTQRYNRNGELIAITEPTGASQQFGYDDLGRQQTMTAVDRKPQLAYYTTIYGYDAAGNRNKVTTPGGSVSSTVYNRASEPVSTTDATDRSTNASYDNLGRRLTFKDSAAIVTETQYDVLGRAAQVRQLSGSPAVERRRWVQAYDPNGNLVQQTTPEGRVRKFGYDAAGRMVRQDEHPADGKVIGTAFGYDANGNRTRLVDGKQQVTQYSFTSWGQPEETVEGGAPASTARYDAAGQQVRSELPGGVVVTSEYDAQSRLIRQAGVGAEAPTADRTFGYDAVGRVTSFGAPGGTSTVSYDDRGNILSLAGPSGSATFRYTADSQLAERADVSGVSQFTYDAAGRPKLVVDGLSGRTIDHAYDSSGRLSVRTEGTTRRVSSYDAVGRVATDKVVVGAENRVLHGTEYGYDLDDNLTAKTTIADGTRTANSYGYDGAGRLASWTGPGGTTQYGWDDAGNRIKAGDKTFTYNNRNQLISDGAKTYTYTARGTLSKAGDRELSFDAFEQLVSDGAAYGYDSLGRVATRGTQPFTYGSLENDVVSDGTRLISRDPTGEPIADRGTGSTPSAKLLYADQRGDVTGRYLDANTFGGRTYDPFGQTTSSNGEQPSLGYQGEWTAPDTGAVNMHSRWYTPETANFTSRDTWAVPPTPGIAGNRYTYVNGSPLLATDPSGHCGPPATVVCAFCARYPYKCIEAAYEVADFFFGEDEPVRRRLLPGKRIKVPYRHQPYCDGCEFGNRPAPTIPRPRPGNHDDDDDDDGDGWDFPVPVPVPPPPPPPLWKRNLNQPPPRPTPGKTNTPRPPRSRADTPKTRVIDRSDELATDSTHVNEIQPTWEENLQVMPDASSDPHQETKNDHRRRDCLNGGPLSRVFWPMRDVTTETGDYETATGVTACVGHDSYKKYAQKDKEYKAGYYPPGYVVGEGMARCHLLPAALKGPGKEPANIVPCWHATTNVKYMRDRMEQCVVDRLDDPTDEQFFYQVSAHYYETGETFPDAIRMVAISNKGFKHSIWIMNDNNDSQPIPTCR